MTLKTYQALVAKVKAGKRVGTSIYLHRSAQGAIPTSLLLAVTTMAGFPEYDLIKLDKRTMKASLLRYPTFFEDAFPGLTEAVSVDLATGKVTRRQYKPENAPILHRKETMLRADHPDVPRFQAVTAKAEAHGLFEKPSTIGFQRRWDALLASKGLYVKGAELLEVV